MNKNEGFTTKPNPISDLKPSGEDIVDNNIPAISSTMNNDNQSRQVVNEPNIPFRNKRKGKHKVIPNSDDFFDNNVTFTVNNDQSTNTLQAQNAQNEDESKNATKEHVHIVSDRVTDVDSNTERRLTNMDPIQASSKVRTRENDLERERQDFKKVKLINDFEEQQPTKTTAIPVQPKLKDFRMREHELDRERHAVKKVKLANHSGEDSRIQHGSTSQNVGNPSTQNTSSILVEGIKKSFSMFRSFLKSDEVTENKVVEIIFHVHLPTSFRSENPVIVGSIEELGNWQEPKVKLQQYTKGISEPTSYWYSQPIYIPIERFQQNGVGYKYAVYSDDCLRLEGDGTEDNRVLEIQRQKFDIWKSNSTYSINQITDYMFLDVIYDSVTSENIKEIILYYDDILKQYRKLTLSVTNVQFISKHVSENSIGRRLFLCFLLGHCSNSRVRFELPGNFQSVPLLQAFINVQSETFPADSWHIVFKGIDHLIHHNINHGLFDWLTFFTVARNFDPQLKFIDTLTFVKCDDDKYIEKCFGILLNHKFDKNTRGKVFKWMMNQCKNLKILSIVWRSSDKIDKQCLVENVEKIISKDDPVDLHKKFTELSDDIRDMVVDQFRKRVLKLLTNGRRAIWDDSKSQTIFDLLTSVQLRWTKDEYIVVLELVSTLEDYQLLDGFPSLLKNWIEISNFDNNGVFPSLLKNWIEIPKEIDNKIIQICIQWYNKLLDRMTSPNSTSHKGEYVTAVIEKLSNFCSLVNEQFILDALMEITLNRIRQSSELSIFNATTNVGQFCSEAVRAFTIVIEEKIDSMDLEHYELLLKKMQVICGCSNKSLEIPNEFCETIICHILSCLQQNPSNTYSLESAKFWIVILRATGSTKKFYSHQLVLETRTSILELADTINNSSINVQLLQKLLNLDNDTLHYYLNSANFNDVEIISKEKLVKVRQNCHFYEQRLKKLDDFYMRFCPLQKTKDVQNYLDELRERSKRLNKISLEESLSEDHWRFHDEILSISESTHELNKSQTFYNVFEKLLNEEIEIVKATDVEFIAQMLIEDALNEYTAKCKRYNKWESLIYSEETLFWCNVSNIEDELNLMEKYSNTHISRSKVFMMTMEFLSRNKDWKERMEDLSKVLEIFYIEERWLNDLFNHGDLRNLKNSIKTINQKFSQFNNNSWAFIKELSRSDEFVEFLRGKTDDDLKNLINGVDEHSDTRLIQEGTISSLIQIKQSLHPFMNDQNLTLETLIEGLNDTIKNPSLISKLSLCNCNVMALKNMYESIYNKGEVTKEKIQNAVTVGTYEFAKNEDDEDCILTLSYSSKLEIMRYNINELQDLRSRALLISKPGVSFGVDDDADDNGKMEEFVMQVDIAQSIIIIMKKLTQLGHFGYRKYNESVKGTYNLEKIAKRLRGDLDIWENIVNQTQETCYYLNFYPARHILAFYDYYTGNGEMRETCQTLVSFVNRKAKLPPLRDQRFNYEKDEYDQALESINHRLGCIFGTLEKHARPMRNSEGRVISDTVKCGELFVAACDDKSKVPNIIMSFYANHGFYPEPWQLLICMTSTTEEELSIFIKRCFFASKNGYKGHLFCIANLELLDFELQYYLVNKIRFFTKKIKDYYLALICCSEAGMDHHIVDQFSKYVHATDGLGTVAMKAIYRQLCPKVTCVTSDLSGQGKTKFIEQESYKYNKTLVSFLISDGTSYNSLIRQLKISHIQQYDDSLHINIISADNHGEVNIFLFQLLTLGIISNNSDISRLPETYIFIELAADRLLKSLPFLNCLNNVHLVWNIDRLMVSKDIHSPIQIVCRYLDLYDRKKLDKQDIIFASRGIRVPLDQVSCQQLLDKYFFQKIDYNIQSFRFLEIFVNVLADQLLRLSGSSFFTVKNLKFMTNNVNIRSTLFETLLAVSSDFATKSTETKSAQLQNITDKAAEVDQLENLVQWDDSNHLLVFFLSQSPESISALYRSKIIVPNNVLELLNSQGWELLDYQSMSSDRLLTILESLARNTMHTIIYQPYALSADNLLKMALMLLRTRANIPVVICGEAGCGKTSLIGFLANVVEVEFNALNLHAGITEKAIKDFMNKYDEKAATREIWLFFDEINTCNHIGLLAELIAHRRLDGKPIHPNIRLFAACNPYRIRNRSVSTVGLKPKKITFEQRSRLVYEVKPLPNQILDYVWDYGTLQSKDEKNYIQIMVQEAKLDYIFAELLFASQDFIRNVEEPYSVSLRDVKRAIKLVDFFYKSLLTRLNEGKEYPDDELDIYFRSYILSLGLCYQSRLYERELRRKYRETMCNIIGNMEEVRFNEIIRDEQMDYMKRMICPPNTAFNEALLENVLAAIVCIMCKIPLFIVGAPGSSKSLAIRLVHQNLRGSDSSDAYFRTLPHAFFIPHQGSSSSTSDGIEKVFQKAKAYQNTSSAEFPVISVVLLDEGK